MIMKNIYRIIMLVALVPLMTGCFEEPGTDQTLTEVFVSASQGSFSLLEGASDEVLIEISEAQSSDVVIDFTIADNNTANGTDYIVSGSSVTIPAGEYSTTLPFEIVNNIVFEGYSRSFTISFSSSVGVDGYDEVVVNLIDDDCELIISDWEGTYTVEEVFSEGGVNAGLSLASAFGESYEVVLTADASDEAGLTATWDNSAGADQFFVPGLVMIFDSCGEAVSFPGGDPNIAAFANLLSITSSFDESNKVINLEGNLSPYGPYEIKLTLQ